MSKNLVFIVLTFLSVGQAQAQFLSEGTLTSFPDSGDYYAGGKDDRGHIYIVPNEINPESAKPILERASEGVYLSVGAERGLIGATLSPKITQLIQMDLVPDVVRYNQLNVILLKVARSREDFIALRTATRHEAWLAHQGNPLLNTKERDLLRDASQFRFYSSVEGAARARLTDPGFFKGSSYLKDDALFERASFLAREGRIQVLQGNLMDSQRVTSLAAELDIRNLKLSVIDLSNAWEPKYIGPKGVDQVVGSLERALNNDSIFMGTSVARCLKTHLCHWNFRGFPYSLLKKAKNIYGSISPMSDLFLMKDHTKANRLLGRIGFWWLYIKGEAPKSALSCKDVF